MADSMAFLSSKSQYNFPLKIKNPNSGPILPMLKKLKIGRPYRNKRPAFGLKNWCILVI
jgi:hypothetical protein